MRHLTNKHWVCLLTGLILTVLGCAPQSVLDSQTAVLDKTTTTLGTAYDRDVAKVRKMPVQYIGTAKKANEYLESLPEQFSNKITLTRANSITLQALASEIYKAQADSGLKAIPVSIMPVLNDKTATEANTQALPVPEQLQGLNLPSPSNSLPDLSTSQIDAFSAGKITPLKYVDVPLKKLLDDVTSAHNLTWRYLNGKIVIYRYITETVRINGIPGNSSLNTSITPSSGGSGGGGSSTSVGSSVQQTTTLNTSSLNVWDSLKTTLPDMLSKQGTAVINGSLGTITLRDEPVVVDEIKRYLGKLNAAMAKQVAIDVTIYTVTLKDKSQYGIDWRVAWNELNNNLKAYGTGMTFPEVAAGSSALSFVIPSSATNSDLKQFSNSYVFLNALESVGTVTNRYSVPVRTQNLQPVQIGNRIQEVYLAESSVLATLNVGASTSLKPGVLNTGIELSILPHIQENNDVVMQYGVSVSNKLGIRTITSISSGASGTNTGGTSVEAPEVGISDFAGRVTMRSGDTLVMSGLEQLTTTVDEVGNLASGGGWSKNAKRVVLVMTITPRLDVLSFNQTDPAWPFNYLRAEV